jgi:ABC-2 type transport system permease protein
MNKIFLIIQREYLTRVKKKSFIIMTILGPLLMAGLMIVPVWTTMQKPDTQKIEVIDESYLFTGLIPEKQFVQFDYPEISFESAQANFYDTDYDAILYIPRNILEGGKAIKLFHKNGIGAGTEEYIGSTISKMVFDVILAQNKVDHDVIKDAESYSRFRVITEKLEVSGKSKKTDTGLSMAIGMGAGVLIYFFIFLYGTQVMRGVMEEKTNRIVEVILSSVKPFDFMMGKIVGVALVGLTQFLIWVILTFALFNVASATILKDIDLKQIQQKEEIIKIGADLKYSDMKAIEKPNAVTQVWNDFKTIDMSIIVICFMFYFLGGYFLYSALFAAVGSAVDNESDTQQFTLPITLPLVLGLVVASYIVQEPESSVAFYLSIIPFTSPIVMMARLPFGVPAWELLLSMSLLVLFFVLMTWFAAKIYRTGILMYGKKVTWRELGKWLFYKG